MTRRKAVGADKIPVEASTCMVYILGFNHTVQTRPTQQYAEDKENSIGMERSILVAIVMRKLYIHLGNTYDGGIKL